jgi:putative ABC transport system substrate-binding protein
VVFTVATDPVRSGLVSNLHRPGGNLTGTSVFLAELEPKRLGLLRELRPDATTIPAQRDRRIMKVHAAPDGGAV